jgi:hypothetical protein
MKHLPYLFVMLLGASSTAQAQDLARMGTMNPASANRCTHLHGELRMVQHRAQAATSAAGAQRAALEQVEGRLAIQNLVPDELIKLLELRLSLWDQIRTSEREVYVAGDHVQMVRAQLRAAGCR